MNSPWKARKLRQMQYRDGMKLRMIWITSWYDRTYFPTSAELRLKIGNMRRRDG